jgi:hypothetical protein
MKRVKSILKWTAISAAALIAILLMANAYFVWSTGTELERRLVELRQAGDPVQLSDLAPEPIPPERNADVYLQRAAADLEAIQKELQALYPKTGTPTDPLAPTEQEKLSQLFAAYPRVMPLVEQAASCPEYDPGIDGSLPTSRFLEPGMERVSKHRLLARVLKARTALLVAQGRLDDAAVNPLLTLRLTRLWRREPNLIGYLVTVACEQVAFDGVNQVLQAGPVSVSVRATLDAELALHDTMDGLRWALRSERAFSLSSVREFPNASTWIGRGFSNDLQMRLIGLFDHFLEQTGRPYREAAASGKWAGPRRGWPNPLAPLVTLLEPSLVASREPADRVRAMSRCLRVLNALQLKVAPVGVQPPKLGELGLPTEVTIDPYNEEALHVKKLPEGWVVYSVGRNLIDDGGTLDKVVDVGVGPRIVDDTLRIKLQRDAKQKVLSNQNSDPPR